MSCCGGCNDRGGGCPHRLAYHTDVSQVPPDNQDVLCWNATAGVWLPCDLTELTANLNIGNMFIPHSLTDHLDVDTSGEVAGDVLTFNGTDWVPLAPATSGTGIIDLDDLGDVNAPAPSANDFLMWNGTEWVPGSIVSGLTPHGLTDHTDVNTAGVTTGEVLTWNGTSWVPLPVPTNSTLPPHALGVHTDVSTTGASNGDLLGFNGTSWLPVNSPSNLNQQVVTGRVQIAGNNGSILSGTGFTLTGAGTRVVTPTIPFAGPALIIATTDSAVIPPTVGSTPQGGEFIITGTTIPLPPDNVVGNVFWNFAMIGPI